LRATTTGRKHRYQALLPGCLVPKVVETRLPPASNLVTDADRTPAVRDEGDEVAVSEARRDADWSLPPPDHAPRVFLQIKERLS